MDSKQDCCIDLTFINATLDEVLGHGVWKWKVGTNMFQLTVLEWCFFCFRSCALDTSFVSQSAPDPNRIKHFLGVRGGAPESAAHHLAAPMLGMRGLQPGKAFWENELAQSLQTHHIREKAYGAVIHVAERSIMRSS